MVPPWDCLALAQDWQLMGAPKSEGPPATDATAAIRNYPTLYDFRELTKHAARSQLDQWLKRLSRLAV